VACTGKSMEEIVDIHIPPTSPDMLREISSIRRSDLTLVHCWPSQLNSWREAHRVMVLTPAMPYLRRWCRRGKRSFWSADTEYPSTR
jgi:hypothetical protein